MITANAMSSDRSRDEPGQQAAGVGAGHGRQAEEHRHAPAHPVRPRVRDRADRAGHPDHQQRRGDGRLGVHAGHVGQQRDGQDRSPAAQQAQRDADEDRQSDGQRDHGGQLALARLAGESDELGHDRLGITGRAAVIGQTREQHAHRAGIGQRGEGQPRTDEGGHPFQAWNGDANQDAHENDQPRHEANLPLQVPTLGATVDRKSRGLPRGDPALEDVHVDQSRGAQCLLGLGGALTGAAHQDDVLVQVLDDLVAVLAQQIQRNVVGPGDVRGLELSGRSHIQNARGCRGVQQIAQLCRIDGGGGRCVHDASFGFGRWLSLDSDTTGGTLSLMEHIPRVVSQTEGRKTLPPRPYSPDCMCQSSSRAC